MLFLLPLEHSPLETPAMGVSSFTLTFNHAIFYEAKYSYSRHSLANQNHSGKTTNT